MVTMRRGSQLGLALVVSGLVACGGSVVRPGDDGGGGSGGTTTTTTVATGGAGGSSTTTSSTTSTTTPTPNVCAPFADEQGLSMVVVRFHNPTSAPVYLPANCGSVRFTVTPVEGDPDVTYAYDDSCLQTCEDLWTSPGFACDACQATVVRVEAGATRDMLWDGTGITQTTAMPSECYASPGMGGCSRVLAAPAGGYVVSLMSYTDCVGECACDSSGVCVGSGGGGDAFQNDAVLSFPDQSLVELIFQPGIPD